MGNKEELCPACNLELNTQKHITECIIIKIQCHKILANNNDAKYEDIFGERPSDEVAIEIPSQNENPQIQIQQARMVQVTIGRPMMPSQTGNQQIASGQCVIIGSIVIITGLILIGTALFISWIFSIPFKLAFIIVAAAIMILSMILIYVFGDNQPL